MVFYRGHPTRTVCVAVYPPRSDIDTLTGRRTCNGHDCAGQQRRKRKTPCSAQSTVVEKGILGLLEETSFSALRQRRPCLSNAGREDCVRQVGAEVFPCLPLLRSGVPRTGNTSSLREMASVSTHYALYTFCVRCSRAQFPQRIEGSLNPARPASTFAFGLPLSEEDTPPCCSRRV